VAQRLDAGVLRLSAASWGGGVLHHPKVLPMRRRTLLSMALAPLLAPFRSDRPTWLQAEFLRKMLKHVGYGKPQAGTAPDDYVVVEETWDLSPKVIVDSECPPDTIYFLDNNQIRVGTLTNIRVEPLIEKSARIKREWEEALTIVDEIDCD
jgi:hypothetical protein